MLYIALGGAAEDAVIVVGGAEMPEELYQLLSALREHHLRKLPEGRMRVFVTRICGMAVELMPAERAVRLRTLLRLSPAAFLLLAACSKASVPPPACEPAGAEPFGLDPFCMTWRDTVDGEEGFVIVLEYGFGPDAETFRYEVEGDSTSFIFPEAESPCPPNGTSLPRSGFRISVTAVLADAEPVEVGHTAAAGIGCPDGRSGDVGG
ncbi:MAG: hypothetical protein Kow0010_17920 [Dehalococcoidia bacterium]